MWLIIPYIIFSLTTNPSISKPQTKGWGIDINLKTLSSIVFHMEDTTSNLGDFSPDVERTLYGIGMFFNESIITVSYGKWQYSDQSTKENSLSVSLKIPISKKVIFEITYTNDQNRDKFTELRVNYRFF